LPLENIRPPSSGERGHLAVEFMGSLRPIWELPAVPAMAGIFVGHGDGTCEAGVKGEWNTLSCVEESRHLRASSWRSRDEEE
jgi:hypothetical protein